MTFSNPSEKSADLGVCSQAEIVFTCQVCGTVAPAKTASQRIVVRTRKQQFSFRQNANQVRFLDDRGKHKVRWTHDPGGTGSQIVLELTACPKCAENVL